MSDPPHAALPDAGYLSAIIAGTVAFGAFAGLLLKGGREGGARLAQLDQSTKDNAAMKDALEALSEKMDAHAAEMRESHRLMLAHMDSQSSHLLSAVGLVAETMQDHEKRLAAVERHP